MPGTLARQRAGICGNMKTRLNSLFVVFNCSCLPKCRVEYYDCIVKWCIGVACQCNLCVSVDIVFTFTLNT